MISDIRTVMWKEAKGLFRFRGSRPRFLLVLIGPLFLAVQVPWDAGLHWVEGFPSLLIAAMIPIIIVGITIPDSFAGERERHTLGTLLASRLPDRAILFGKVGLTVASAMGVTLFVLILSLITVNVRCGGGKLLFYSPNVLLADLVFSFVMATLVAGAGVLISLRSATIQEATQSLMAIFFVPPMILGAVLMLLRDRIHQLLGTLNFTQLFLVALAVMAIVDLGLHLLAMARFQRSRLSLD